MALKIPAASDTVAKEATKRRGEAQVDERPAPTRKAAGSKPATSAIHEPAAPVPKGPEFGDGFCADPDCEFRRIVMAQRAKAKVRLDKHRGKT